MSSNRVVHFEIPANQPEALTKFYAEMFGWSFQKFDMPDLDYWTCTTGSEDEPGINGAIMQRQDPRHPWMNYILVDDIETALEKALRLGAKPALPRTPVADMGAFAAFMDPDGNMVGLWENAKK